MKDPARTWNAIVVGEHTPCWSVTRRHERLKPCAAHARARCCRYDSFANPGRRRLTVAHDTAGTPASPTTQTVQLAGRLDDAGQHQLTEHLVPTHSLLEPEHLVGRDQGIHQMPHPRRRGRQRAIPPRG
jgi:hypothetical protein